MSTCMALGYTCTGALCHLRVSSCLAISAPTEDICKEGEERGVTTSLPPSARDPYLVSALEVSIQLLDVFLQGLSCTMPPSHTSSTCTHTSQTCVHAQCVNTYLNFTVLSSNHFIKSSPNRECKEERRGGSSCYTMYYITESLLHVHIPYSLTCTHAYTYTYSCIHTYTCTCTCHAYVHSA